MSDPIHSGTQVEHNSDSPPVPVQLAHQRNRKVWVEDVEDDGDEDEPHPARFEEVHPTAGYEFPGRYKTTWRSRSKADKAENRPPWHPFASFKEWQLVKWMMACSVSQTSLDSYLKLQIVSDDCLFSVYKFLISFMPLELQRYEAVVQKQIQVSQEGGPTADRRGVRLGNLHCCWEHTGRRRKSPNRRHDHVDALSGRLCCRPPPECVVQGRHRVPPGSSLLNAGDDRRQPCLRRDMDR